MLNPILEWIRVSSDNEMCSSIHIGPSVQTHRINTLVVFLAEINDWAFDIRLNPEFESEVDSDSRVVSNYIGRTKLWKNVMELSSAPFAAKVFQVVAIVYGGWECSPDTVFDRREFLSEVEQIRKWREMLTGTIDERERRTPVEDIAGKILPTCWRGVASETAQVLREACKFPSDAN